MNNENFYNEFKDLNIKELNLSYWSACKNNEIDKVKYLLTSPQLKKHANINYDSKYLIDYICSFGSVNLLEYLTSSKDLEEHIKITQDISTLVRSAIRQDSFPIVQYLLSLPKLKPNTDLDIDEIFIDACGKGNLNIIKYLLTSPELIQHANIHAKDNAYKIIDSPILTATSHGHIEVVKYLLSSSELKEHADVHANHDEVFRLAVNNNYLSILEYLIFEYKINKTPIIENFLNHKHNLNSKIIKNMFELRDVNEGLNAELPINEHSSKKVKI